MLVPDGDFSCFVVDLKFIVSAGSFILKSLTRCCRSLQEYRSLSPPLDKLMLEGFIYVLIKIVVV